MEKIDVIDNYFSFIFKFKEYEILINVTMCI